VRILGAVDVIRFASVANEERVSSVRVDRPTNHASQQAANGAAPPVGQDVALEFVRFCYRRRRVAWPELYDEMCAVAARGAFRGLGYAELAERGISFSLFDLPRLADVTRHVLFEEQAVPEPRSDVAPQMRLAAAQAGG
jgi:hypothetical protein